MTMMILTLVSRSFPVTMRFVCSTSRLHSDGWCFFRTLFEKSIQWAVMSHQPLCLS